jgi:plasmid rolling circle replication initiator protein Rep
MKQDRKKEQKKKKRQMVNWIPILGVKWLNTLSKKAEILRLDKKQDPIVYALRCF